jgi:4-hydroxybenzoate polyprenyltransferase
MIANCKWAIENPFVPSLSQRVLTLLQFTRIALVFTAISNGWAAMLLNARATGVKVTPMYAVAMTVASIGLYTFGMALNDLIDRRRDSQIASHRPLPSGRISVRTAHLICVLLGILGLAGAGALVALHPQQWLSLIVAAWTLLLIMFYDYAGKYLVALGLIALGLIRFFHATIAAPTLEIPWHPIVLLVHVTLLSTVCYGLEGKRPRLTVGHWVTVIGGLALIIGALLTALVQRHPDVSWQIALWAKPQLAYVGAAVVMFIALAITIRYQHRDPRAAGRTMMLYGLLWLIVYDATFVFIYAEWKWWGSVVLALMPVSLLAVQIMRAWSKLMELSAKPQYQRAR